MTPYYEQDGIAIYHGDCREVLPSLDRAPTPWKIVVALDPPYGIEHESSHGASWENTQIQNDHSTELRDWLIEHLSPWPMFVCGTWKVEKPKATRQTLIWNKGPAFGQGDLAFPWKNSFEEIYVIGDGFIGKRDEAVLHGHLVPSWESHGRKHPHEKPVSLWSALLRKAPEGLVLDPCCGTGSSLQAAKLAGRRAIGIEIEEKYCEVAANRLRQRVLFGSEVA